MSTIKHSYNRILEISDDHKQITLPDSRFYRRNGNYYPSVSKDIIPFELFINWESPIVLCEGPFDAMAIKRK